MKGKSKNVESSEVAENELKSCMRMQAAVILSSLYTYETPVIRETEASRY